jgi:lipid A 3-O-deacylase
MISSFLSRFISGTLGLFGLCCAAFSIPAMAADPALYETPPTHSSFRWMDEVRAGAYVHSPGYTEGNTLSLSGELLTSRLPVGFSNPIASFVFGPRLNVGFTANVQGYTSFVYTGFTWTYDVTDSIFLETSFGGGVHNGELEPPVPQDRLKLGCRALFREGATLGYRLSEHWSVMASVEHLSHAGLCSSYNNGITTAGGRIGYRF